MRLMDRPNRFYPAAHKLASLAGIFSRLPTVFSLQYVGLPVRQTSDGLFFRTNLLLINQERIYRRLMGFKCLEVMLYN